MGEALRPTTWEAFIGQDRLKDRLELHIDAAKRRDELLGHLLLVGPPGSGKTSLATLVAKELETDFLPYMMPVKLKMIQKVLMNFEGVLFLDEIHRLSKKDQEWFLSVLEDGYFQTESGTKFPLPGHLTVIGATTEPEKIIKPLYDRFVLKPAFEEYTDDQMAEIVSQLAARLDLYITEEDAMALGKASAGIPRQARNIVWTARDAGTTEPDIVLPICGITEDGLTENHMHYLKAIDHLGMTAGIDLLSNYLRLPKDILLDVERLLIKRKFITYSAKGRVLTLAGHQKMQPKKVK